MSTETKEVIITHNDFPKMKYRVPFEYQLSEAGRMVSLKKTILAHEAGLGKTMTTIMATETIGRKTIIVTTASVKNFWKKEIQVINPDADVNVLESKDEYKDAHYIILNYEIMEKFLPELLSNEFEVVVFDEGHKLRGVNDRGTPSSKRARYGLKLAENMEYVYPVTATPIVNKNKDVFNLLVAIEHPDSKYWNPWANAFCVRQTEFGKDYNNSYNTEKLRERLYPNGILRLRTEEKINLPERVRSFIPVNVDLNKYNKLIQNYMDNRRNISSRGENLVWLSKMRQALAIAKVKVAIKLIQDYLDQEEKVVVFTNVKIVAEKLKSKFKEDVAMITGDTPQDKRPQEINNFQNGNAKVFVGNVDASGEGVTLTSARHMIVIDFHWSPIVLVNQMEKRIHRISQTEPVKIEYLYASNSELEEKIVDLLNEKLKNATDAIDGTKETFIDEIVYKLSNDIH